MMHPSNSRDESDNRSGQQQALLSSNCVTEAHPMSTAERFPERRCSSSLSQSELLVDNFNYSAISLAEDHERRCNSSNSWFSQLFNDDGDDEVVCSTATTPLGGNGIHNLRRSTRRGIVNHEDGVSGFVINNMLSDLRQAESSLTARHAKSESSKPNANEFGLDRKKRKKMKREYKHQLEQYIKGQNEERDQQYPAHNFNASSISFDMSSETRFPSVSPAEQLVSGEESSLGSGKTCESNPPSSFSSLFGQILQDFRDNRHLPDQPVVLEDSPPGVNSDTSLSPRPLAPDVELMHSRSQQVSCSSSPTSEQQAKQISGHFSDVKSAKPEKGGGIPVEAMSYNISPESKQGTKRKKRKEPPPPPSTGENTHVVGMGFFSQLQESGTSFNQVQATTEIKKKSRRKRKLKMELLEGVDMGFFSRQMRSNDADINVTSTEKRELSDRLKPLYDWAPEMDARFRTNYELFSPVLLPIVALCYNHSSFARAWSFSLPVLHTLETLLTNFGPKAAGLHFNFAPIDPFWHMCIDMCQTLPIIVYAFVRPEHFGSHAYTQAIIFAVTQFLNWAMSYKYVVLWRKAKSKQTQ